MYIYTHTHTHIYIIGKENVMASLELKPFLMQTRD